MRRDEDEPLTRLDAGPAVRTFYTSADVRPDLDERPGEYPYTRGVTADRGRPLVKLYAGLGSPEASNLRYRNLQRWGAEEIQMATDLPSQIGYDSNHIMAAGEVGRAGVAISSVRDMEVLFDGIRLDSLARVGMLGNSIGPIAVALFVALGERQGIRIDDYVVDLQNDPLKEYVARGTQFLPIDPAVRLAADVVEWCAENAPHWYPLDICVNHLNAAGAGSTHGTAFALANAITYIEELLGRGVPIDRFAPTLQMFLDEREDFFAAVANVRATRRIWARLLRDRFGAQDPRSLALEVTAYGHGRETRQEPLTNIVRIALGCLAYRVAGVQTLYSSSFDEALATPSDDAVRIATRTLQVLGCEQGLDATVDPLGGSYYLEWLTDELEARIGESLDEVEELGGAVACIKNGHMRSVITEGAVRRQQWFESGERAVVGLNRFVVEGDEAVQNLQIARADPDVERIMTERLAVLRRERDDDAVTDALHRIESAGRESRNVVPSVIDAIRREATIGEVADTFRRVFGEWEPDQQF